MGLLAVLVLALLVHAARTYYLAAPQTTHFS